MSQSNNKNHKMVQKGNTTGTNDTFSKKNISWR